MQWFGVTYTRRFNLRNGRIGEVLGLGYSSVSRRAHIVRERIQKDRVFKKKFKDIKSKIKI